MCSEVTHRGNDITVGTSLFPQNTKQFHGLCVRAHVCIHVCVGGVTNIFLILFPFSVSTDHTHAGISQSPTNKVTKRGQNVAFRCNPISGHNRLYCVYWYQQAPAQGPQFLVQYYEKLQRSKGNFPDRFSAQQFGDYHSELNMSTLQLGDSATYLCASSLHSPVESLAFCT
uniref:Ig-like domain-containing protein n=1 Tax=Sciurus vulgaris TaxID=55149 RepID=A0A8D2D0Q2_SCIVU